ncbi:MDR family MFS transporter [Furfurilactobacillus curtus]|uniref:MFS transporter n=1 Tax=Furfurilactobacillus curtus TaxID=1746200 RepID=A0ABQ5JPL5_9LACO
MATNTQKLSRHTLAVAWILVIGALAPMLDSTMVNIAIHSLTTSFHSTVATVQWTITGYVLATGIAVPFSGWLINRFNGKFVFLFGEIIFLIGSLLSATAGSINALNLDRLVQGFGAGIIVPLLTTLLVQTAGQEHMGQLMAVVGLPILLGPILGPVIGGIILKYLSWRWIFWINAPVAALSAGIIIWKLPNFPALNKQAWLDWPGTLLLAAGSSAIIYGVVQASTKASFTNHSTLTFASVGLVIFAIYFLWSWRAQNKAVLPLSLFAHRSFNASMISLLLAGVVMNGPMLLLPLFFQQVRGMSVINAGLMLIPQGLGMLVARPTIGRLIDTIGSRDVVLVSLVLTFVGTLPFTVFGAKTSVIWIAIVLFVRGIGVGGILSPLMTDAYTGLQPIQIPAASIGTRITQNVGGALGSAFVATLISKYVHAHLNHFQHQVKTGHYHVQPAEMATFLHHHMILIQLHAFQNAFLITTLASLLMFLPALFLTNKRKQQKNLND